MEWLNLLILGAGWILSSLCVAMIVFWIFALWIVCSGRRTVPSLDHAPSRDQGRIRRGDSTPCDSTESSAELVSVIIPAHNEELLIDDAIRSIRNSTHRSIEILIVADRCTDRTVEIAQRHEREDPRVRIVEVDHCPEEWSGKCHSCWNGYQHATGDYLLFTDADTIFHADLVNKSLDYMHWRELDLLSLLGSLRCQFGFEQSAQPVAAMSLMRMYPIERANRHDPDARRPFANGQFMLFKREPYESIGTHERLKDAILEDLRFARRMSNQGFRIGVTLAVRHFKVRMYETAAEFVRGWKRIFIEAANRNVPRLRNSSRRLRVLAAFPLVSGASLVNGALIFSTAQRTEVGWLNIALGIGSLLVAGIVLAIVYRVQGAPLRCLWQFPIGCLQVASIFREAADDLSEERGIDWAALHYRVDASEETGPPITRKGLQEKTDDLPTSSR